MSTRPLLSLVIPTRERDETLRYALRTVIAQRYPDLEIIVSDNAGRGGTRRLVEDEAGGDLRVRYVNPQVRLGMSEHWEFALAQASGQYVTFMGDDDGMYPDSAARIAKQIIELNRPLLLSWPQSTYMWTNVPDIFFPGLLSLPLPRGEIRHVDASSMIPQAPYNLMRLLTREYPSIYNKAALSRDLIQRVKADSGGTFFRSRIPDVYSGLVASLYVSQIPVMGAPMMINAQSARSNGVSFTQPTGEGAEAEAFRRESQIEIHPDAGGKMSGLLQILWWETALQAQDAVGHKRHLNMPDPRSVLRSAFFSAQSIRDDATYEREMAILHNISRIHYCEADFQGWSRVARRRPVVGRIQRTGYQPSTDTLFIETINSGALNIADAVKIAAHTIDLYQNVFRPGWKWRSALKYHMDYLATRFTIANIIRYILTRR